LLDKTPIWDIIPQICGINHDIEGIIRYLYGITLAIGGVIQPKYGINP
jgi:hypothetical protein